MLYSCKSRTCAGNLNRHKKVKHGLNESTRNMEEDAVRFLNTLSERAHEEHPEEDSINDFEINGEIQFEGTDDLDPNDVDSLEPDGNERGMVDVTGSKLDAIDCCAYRKQRKSIPRKIHRHISVGRHRQGVLRNSKSERGTEPDNENCGTRESRLKFRA